MCYVYMAIIIIFYTGDKDAVFSRDGDGIQDTTGKNPDNCLDVANADQLDQDGDGKG